MSWYLPEELELGSAIDSRDDDLEKTAERETTVPGTKNTTTVTVW